MKIYNTPSWFTGELWHLNHLEVEDIQLPKFIEYHQLQCSLLLIYGPSPTWYGNSASGFQTCYMNWRKNFTELAELVGGFKVMDNECD